LVLICSGAGRARFARALELSEVELSWSCALALMLELSSRTDTYQAQIEPSPTARSSDVPSTKLPDRTVV